MCLIAACGSADSGPIEDPFIADATVQGSVVDLAGSPLAGIDVAIYVRPGTSPFPYQSGHATTNMAGSFRVSVYRIFFVGSAPQPDTLTARVVVTANGPQYNELPGGGFPTDSSVAVLLQFVPHNTQGPVASATVRWKIP